MTKQTLREHLSRCQNVIRDELTLLQNWQNAPGITAGRAAQCDSAISYIESGLSSPAAIIQNILDQIDDLDDGMSLKDPSNAHLSLVGQCEASIATRSKLNGPGLSPSLFENSLGMAQDNSHHTADCAASIFQDCTS